MYCDVSTVALAARSEGTSPLSHIRAFPTISRSCRLIQTPPAPGQTESQIDLPFLKSLPPHAGPPAIFTEHPEIYGPWSTMSQALMNGPSSLSQGERELILAYAAGVGGCKF